MARSAIFDHYVFHDKLTSRFDFHTIGYHKTLPIHKLTSQIELSTLWPFWHFLTVFALMTAALFCYFFTFLLKKGGQKRVPQNRLIIRKTHFMGGTLKNRGHILWCFTRDSWVCQGVRCPSQKSLFFRRTENGERTDIGSEKLPDVIGASRNYQQYVQNWFYAQL